MWLGIGLVLISWVFWLFPGLLLSQPTSSLSSFSPACCLYPCIAQCGRLLVLLVLLLELKLLTTLRDFGSLSFSSGLASLPHSSWHVVLHCQYCEKCHLVHWAEEMYFLTKKFILLSTELGRVGDWRGATVPHFPPILAICGCSWSPLLPTPILWGAALAHTPLTDTKVLLLPPGLSPSSCSSDRWSGNFSCPW